MYVSFQMCMHPLYTFPGSHYAFDCAKRVFYVFQQFFLFITYLLLFFLLPPPDYKNNENPEADGRKKYRLKYVVTHVAAIVTAVCSGSVTHSESRTSAIPVPVPEPATRDRNPMMSDVGDGAGHRLQQGRATSLILYLAHQHQHRHQQHLMAQQSLV